MGRRLSERKFLVATGHDNISVPNPYPPALSLPKGRPPSQKIAAALDFYDKSHLWESLSRRHNPYYVACFGSVLHGSIGVAQGTLRLDLIGGQHTSGEPSRAEGSKTPSQAALVPYGSDRVNRDPPKKGLAAQPPGR